MNRITRALLIVISVTQIGAALAFILQVSSITRLWPLPYTNAASYLFIGSIFAAAAASTLWCVFTGESRALAGIALDYITIFIPLAGLLFQLAARTRRADLTTFGVISIVSVAFGLGMLLWSRRQPVRDTQPAPRLVVGSFAFFVVALLIAGGLMIFKSPRILPWSTSMDSQIIYGWMFLGAAAYFAYGVLRPGWYNAGGQLAGFLAYDVVLIGPFLARLGNISPDLLPNLIIYILVVSYSGLLAIYYLFIHAPTRLWRPRRTLATSAGD
jgi:hypothetical protein